MEWWYVLSVISNLFAAGIVSGAITRVLVKIVLEYKENQNIKINTYA